MQVLNNCKVLGTGSCFITQSYQAHLQNVATNSRAYACGVDVVSCNAYGGYVQTDVLANSDGRVIYADVSDGYGYAVWIDHGSNNLVSGYGHMKDLKVKQGQFVKAGQPLGTIASTGTSTGVHLHFELRKYIAPYALVTSADFWNPNGFMNRAKFAWQDPTPYLTKMIVEKTTPTPTVTPTVKPSNTSDYDNNITPNRFKVKLNNIQKGAYTNFKNACSHADRIGGVVIDSLTNVQVYPVTQEEDYTKSTIPNRFRVMLEIAPNYMSQQGAFTNYNNALSLAKRIKGRICDSAHDMKVIY